MIYSRRVGATFADTIDTSLLEIGIGLSLLLLESLPPVLLLADLSHRREKKERKGKNFVSQPT